MYPGLARKYGPIVTYQEKPSAHMKVEYGFDVDQVAEGNYAPKAYHDFVGFEVSKSVLERAFARTYSLDMSSVFFSLDLSIGSYRHAVSTVIPRMTKVAWHLKRDEIQNSHPSETKKEFIYNISTSGYRKEWGHIYEKPGFAARLKAFFLRLVPKVGPFSGLAFHPPTPAVEQLYMNSFNETLDHYRALLLAHREDRLQVNPVAFRRVFGADAVDQAQRHLGPGLNREINRLGSSLLGGQESRDDKSSYQHWPYRHPKRSCSSSLYGLTRHLPGKLLPFPQRTGSLSPVCAAGFPAVTRISGSFPISLGNSRLI